MKKPVFILIALLFCVHESPAGVKDTPFLQPVARKHFFRYQQQEHAVSAMSVAPDGSIWAVVGERLYMRRDTSWQEIDFPEVEARAITSLRHDEEGNLWCATPAAVIKISNQRLSSVINLRSSLLTFLPGESGETWLGCTDGLYYSSSGLVERVKLAGDRHVQALALDAGGRLWVGTDNGLYLQDGLGWKQMTTFDTPALPSNDILALACQGAVTWVGTDAGLAKITADTLWQQFGREQNIPYLRISALQTQGDTLWAGTDIGLIALHGGRWKFFGAMRWLPHPVVSAIATTTDGHIWVGTGNGLAEIYHRRLTLADKAAYYEAMTRQRHIRWGFVGQAALREFGNPASYQNRDSDNDGLWTAMYVAAECYRYAVTKDPEAKKNAIESFKALERLETITPIRGFPARSFKHRTEPPPTGGEWHWTEDKEWRWKGDTSSDEIDGHFYAIPIYYLLIDDEQEKERAANLADRIMSYILDSGLVLPDLDGKPTLWGVWTPDSLKTKNWEAERGLNALEILSHLKVAYHLTGKAKYQEAYLKLINEHDYAKNMITQKAYEIEVNHSDDELAFLAYYPLFLFEKDPALLAIYRQSMERSWMMERPEKNPLWNYIASVALGREIELDAAAETLRDIPLDLIDWPMDASQRLDICFASAPDRHGVQELVAPLPFSERPLMKWNGNPYRFKGGGGFAEECGTFWLLPYWMGRYYGFIE